MSPWFTTCQSLHRNVKIVGVGSFLPAIMVYVYSCMQTQWWSYIQHSYAKICIAELYHYWGSYIDHLNKLSLYSVLLSVWCLVSSSDTDFLMNTLRWTGSISIYEVAARSSNNSMSYLYSQCRTCMDCVDMHTFNVYTYLQTHVDHVLAGNSTSISVTDTS